MSITFFKTRVWLLSQAYTRTHSFQLPVAQFSHLTTAAKAELVEPDAGWQVISAAANADAKLGQAGANARRPARRGSVTMK